MNTRLFRTFILAALFLPTQTSWAMSPVATDSDRRMKRNIEPLEASLKNVTKLQGVRFDWRTDEYPDHGFRNTKQIGLIAQEVEKVLPELVHTDREGYKPVSYRKLTAVPVDAVKEVKADYEERLKKQERLIEELERIVLEMGKAVGESSSKD